MNQQPIHNNIVIYCYITDTFIMNHYTGYHSKRGRVYLCTIQQGDSLICVQDDDNIGLEVI